MISAIFPGRGVMTNTRSARNTDFRDRMRDEHNGLAISAPDAQHFDVHLLARHGIERAEWFVHQ